MPQTAQTPSPICDDLLNGLRGFDQGQVTAAQIEHAVGVIRGKMAESRRQTFERIEAAGREHEKTYSAQINALRVSFDFWEQALDALLNHTKAKTPESAQRAEGMLRQAAFASQYSADWYMRSELEQGPTRMPVVNLLYKMREAKAPQENFRAAVDGAARMMAAAIAELADQPAAADLRKAYARHQAALEKLGPDTPLDEVTATGEAVRDALDGFNQAAMVAGPSRQKRANVLLNHLQAHESGAETHETLLAALKSFRQDLDEERQEVERLGSMPTSPKVTRLLAVTREAYRLHEQALAMVEEIGKGAPLHEQARQELLDAAETLADCREEFEALGETEGKILCVRCSAPNPPGQRTCGKCNAVLPASGAGGPASTLSVDEHGVAEAEGEWEVTENIEKLFIAVNEVAEGKIGADQFGEVLAWMDGLLVENLTHLPALPAFRGAEKLAEEHRAQLAQVELELQTCRDEMLEGSQDFREALARMSCYLEDHNKEHLTVGVQAVRDAVVKIQTQTRRIEQLAAQAQAPPEEGTA